MTEPEFFHVPFFGNQCQCKKCKGEIEWIDCPDCEDGYSHHDCGEDTCCCRHPENNVKCDSCNGKGGTWYCEKCDNGKK